jgi:PIN domain nuclease of toxin-antitoxin system
VKEYLLDTHALLWWLFDSPELSGAVRGLIADRSNAVYVSAANAWEIATKYRLGRLPEAAQLVQDIPGWVQKAGFLELPVSLAHAQRAGSFQQPHRDPFDRMLAAQSLLEDLPLISCDDELRAFGATIVW